MGLILTQYNPTPHSHARIGVGPLASIASISTGAWRHSIWCISAQCRERKKCKIGCWVMSDNSNNDIKRWCAYTNKRNVLMCMKERESMVVTVRGNSEEGWRQDDGVLVRFVTNMYNNAKVDQPEKIKIKEGKEGGQLLTMTILAPSACGLWPMAYGLPLYKWSPQNPPLSLARPLLFNFLVCFLFPYHMFKLANVFSIRKWVLRFWDQLY